MRVLIVGDIHSNLEAFQAVLDDARRRGGFDRLWCLGDVVGYGPDPGPCIELLQENDALAVAGNHDYAAVGRADLSLFNAHAAAACRWTGQKLLSEHRRYLEGLPTVVEESPFTLVHGSLRDPVWEYLLAYEAAQATFDRCATPHCLVAHSHVPFLCRDGEGFQRLLGDQRVSLAEGRFIINPGSVGQPRDGDPRASYVLYDADGGCVEHCRVAYDVATTQEKMRRAGLPHRLIERLGHGW